MKQRTFSVEDHAEEQLEAAVSVFVLQYEMCREVWRPVVGWENLYKVSHLMRVCSLPRLAYCGAGRWRTAGGKLLVATPSKKRYGYPYVTLCNGGEVVTRDVHRLVADAFLGLRPAGQETRHGPGGRLEAAVTNLSYGSHIENEMDKERDGGRARGERSGQGKLTEADVISIRTQHQGGASIHHLAREFGVTRTTVSLIVRGIRWAHVPLEVPVQRGTPEDLGQQELPLQLEVPSR